MPICHKRSTVVMILMLMSALALLFASNVSRAQSSGSASISGTILDPTGAVVPGATVEIHNAVSAFDRKTTTDGAGTFTFGNVPFNPYHMTVVSPGFAAYAQDVEVRSIVPASLNITLQVETSSSTVSVEAGGDLVETDSVAHTDIDRGTFDKIPLESQTSSLTSLVTLSSPGVSADSNGLVHGLGDHAANSFSIDGQPITDQQSKVFSNQVPLDSIQSLEVIPGAPPAEYGGKTSLVIVATTRSGQGVTTPHGSINASYGSFGSSNGGFDLSYGGAKWGNFISANGLQTGRFLDPQEFAVMHDKGNEQNLFDRIDYTLSAASSLHLNLGYTRSWFQTPNSFDGENATPWNGVVVNNAGLDPNGNVVGPTDQRSKIETFNIAPTWTRVLSTSSVFTLGAFIRRDDFNYYPSKNPFADLGPSNLQQESIAENRTLANTGLHSDVSYVKGIHNLKVGATYQQTFLTENDHLGIVDPTLELAATDSVGSPCFVGGIAVAAPCTTLLPFDLTRGGSLFSFHGHTDVKELALYVQDTITKGAWSFNLGIRGDLYNGLTRASQAEPRLGIAYNIKPSSTVLRISYARTLETPFNENLILSSEGCRSAVIAALIPCVNASLPPGFKNEFHVGLQQAFGRYAVVSGDYIWKYTHTGYDFSVLGATPITFPIGWHNSKIPGYAIRVSVPEFHGFTALVVMSSVAARFFPPQTGGLGATVGQGGQPFRIDHDEKFNQTTHFQYQPWKNSPWLGFNWRYDSGQVAGRVPFSDGVHPVDLSALSADQEFEAGLSCDGVRATPTQRLPSSCPSSQFSSTLVKIPAPGTENPDHNPPRVQPRNLFDVSVGDDNLFKGDRYKWSLNLTAINIANKYSLYNFLSTFSGTHYVAPRTLTAQLGFHF